MKTKIVSKEKLARKKKIEAVMKQFKAQFRDDGDCIQFLVENHNAQRERGDLRCKCGNLELPKTVRRRKVQCNRCGKQWFLTAGTLFHRARSLKPYIVVIRLFESGITIQAQELADLFDIAYSTAFVIIKKVSMVLVEKMDASMPSAASRVWTELYTKRTTQTERASRPVTEENAFDRQRVVVSKETQIESILPTLPKDFASAAESVLRVMAHEFISFEAIATRTRLETGRLNGTLTILELERHVESQPGGMFRLKSQLSSADRESASLETIESFKSQVRKDHGGVGRKYIQIYAAVFWCLEDRKRWCRGALLEACLKSGPISQEKIIDYVSPAYVLMLAS